MTDNSGKKDGLVYSNSANGILQLQTTGPANIDRLLASSSAQVTSDNPFD
eukprot:CAMPEP_0113932454 /NCGR_PEP_ID=MMETSP1159-20121227/7123_1 /TAXON_ID=88271 /ORGANISM="Picocystis salinarum" /LENGTH=49 /DNA_ID=CAMNT_0000933567 /DNA_START=237 /DNA_END=386 /DNA_ORIENTATION=+ /assembly_acc=CAM_ASM_000767